MPPKMYFLKVELEFASSLMVMVYSRNTDNIQNNDFHNKHIDVNNRKGNLYTLII